MGHSVVIQDLDPKVRSILKPLLNTQAFSVLFDPEPLYSKVIFLRQPQMVALRTELASTAFASSQEGVERWNRGWKENAESLSRVATGDLNGAFRAVAPRYFFKSQIFRIDGAFATTENPDFEVSMHRFITMLILSKCLSRIDCERINLIELGCGSAHNLLVWSKFKVLKSLVGADWSPSSELCINQIERVLDNSKKFKFLSLDLKNDFSQLEGKRDTLFVTCHALEQITRPFSTLQGLATIPNALVLNIEPVVERYRNDQDGTLLSQLHRRRAFSTGLEVGLRVLERQRAIHMIDKGFVDFGSAKSEPYSWFFWQSTRS